jgi:hypothetical protein
MRKKQTIGFYDLEIHKLPKNHHKTKQDIHANFGLKMEVSP